MISLYVHLPFCRSRCIYCDFYSTTLQGDVMARYVDALEHECQQRLDGKDNIYKCTRVHTIYIGGGTPSLLPPDLLQRLFDFVGKTFSIDPDAEVTVEANPDDISRQWLQSLKETPVNRISMGVQTFSNPLLRFLSRRHDAQQAISAVRLCQEAGYENVSIDLIYGLPRQTMSQWQSDVEQALSLGITHLSAYSLTFEEGTRLDTMLRKGLVDEADEELSRQMYHFLMSATEKAGFQHYEISNFAKPGFHSRHNSCYWQGTPYLGLGAGAHSYDGERTRRANLPDIKAYIAASADVPHETEVLSDSELYDEFIMTRLRTAAGIPLSELPLQDRNYCLAAAEPHLCNGRLSLRDEHLCLTKQGIFTSNDIISDLMK